MIGKVVKVVVDRPLGSVHPNRMRFFSYDCLRRVESESGNHIITFAKAKS